MNKTAYVLLVLAALFAGAEAQEPVDAVVAKVEDMPILKSEVDRQVELYRLTAPLSKVSDDSLRRMAMESLIETNLMLIRAKAESLAVTDQEVENRLNLSIENMRSQFPTEEAFNAQLKEEGMTLAQLKDKHRRDARSQVLIQKLIDRSLRPKVAEPTAKEMEKFYDSHRDSFPPEPERVELSHILIVPKPGEQANRSFEAKVRQVLAAIQEKKLSFATIAKRHSMDKRSAPEGGELGWVVKEDLFPEIRDKIQKLRAGQVSDPVQSRAGIHFVKMMEKQGERMRLAHILLFPEPTEADVARARKTANGLRTRVTTGGEEFAKVAQTYSDDEETKDKGGSLGLMPVEAFGRYPEIKDELAAMAEGEISDVMRTETGFHVFKLHKRLPMQQPTYETVKPQLREYIMGRKMQELYEKCCCA